MVDLQNHIIHIVLEAGPVHTIVLVVSNLVYLHLIPTCTKPGCLGHGWPLGLGPFMVTSHVFKL